MRADLLNRIERIRAALVGRRVEKPTLIYADGSTRSMSTLGAMGEVSSGADVVDVLSESETTRSLLLAMRGPWDFSDLEELAGQ